MTTPAQDTASRRLIRARSDSGRVSVDTALFRIMRRSDAWFLQDLINHFHADYAHRDGSGYVRCQTTFFERCKNRWSRNEQTYHFRNLTNYGFVRTRRHRAADTEHNVRWVFVDMEAIEAALDWVEEAERNTESTCKDVQNFHIMMRTYESVKETTSLKNKEEGTNKSPGRADAGRGFAAPVAAIVAGGSDVFSSKTKVGTNTPAKKQRPAAAHSSASPPRVGSQSSKSNTTTPTKETKTMILAAAKSGTHSDQDERDAKEFMAVLRKRGRLTPQRHSVTNWAKSLAATRRKHPADYDAVFRFHLDRVGEKYHPHIFSAKQFRARFHDLMGSRKKYLAARKEDAVEISADAREIVDDLKKRYPMPAWVEEVLPAVAQRSIDGVRAAMAALRRVWERCGRGQPEPVPGKKDITRFGPKSDLALFAEDFRRQLCPYQTTHNRLKEMIEWAADRPGRRCRPDTFVVTLTSDWLGKWAADDAVRGGWSADLWGRILKEADRAE